MDMLNSSAFLSELSFFSKICPTSENFLFEAKISKMQTFCALDGKHTFQLKVKFGT